MTWLKTYKENEALLHEMSYKMTLMILAVSPLVWLSWIPVDYYLTPSYWKELSVINIVFAFITYLVYTLLKKEKISNTTGQYFAVIPPLLSLGFLVNLASQEFLLVYFVSGGITVGMVVYAFMLLPPIKSILFSIFGACAIILFNLLIGKHTLSFILETGGVMYAAISFFGIALSFAKYRFTVASQKQSQTIIQQKKELEQANHNLENALKDRALYLHEMQHRVKNNLQMIYSLVSLQETYKNQKSTDEILKSLQFKILSISTIHDLFVKTDEKGNSLNLSEYIEKLMIHYESLFNLSVKDIKIKFEVNSNIILPLDIILPCGLIINEAVTNSIKYAYTKKQKGEIQLTVNQNNDVISIVVEDDGDGFDMNQNESGLGTELMQGLASQVNGELKINSVINQGTVVTLKFTLNGK